MKPTVASPISAKALGRPIWAGALLKGLSPLLGAIVIVAIWKLATIFGDVPPYVLPDPAEVARSLWLGLATPPSSPLSFYPPIVGTLSTAAVGFLTGSVLGILIGSVMAEFKRAETILMPYAFALQTLPKIAVAPLIVLWFGFGDGSKIALAALMTFFPLMVNTFAGLRSVPGPMIDLMKSLSATRLQTYARVKVPAAAPYVFAGLDMGVVYALLGTIIAEFLGAQRGVGVTITQAQAVSDVATVFAMLFVLGAIGIALHLTVRTVRRRAIHWQGE